ncbi:histidine phosphatase family protein [Clostridium polynesiense]|uniref:histidine phosphatase family protein n=1 Tax=Clostridium polynesiense TaxID=1325933 RepID=UPI00058D4F8D|nr:histidine phosphatase family protein [Clostridium polynesiense]
MTTLYITRHGETEWNLMNRFQGWKNSPLTEKGIKQAESLHKRMSSIPLRKIYTSPTERAAVTAEIIRGDRNIDIIKDEGLREMGFGNWEGLTHEEIRALNEKEYNNLLYRPSLYVPDLGEDYATFKERIISTVDKIILAHPEEAVLIVTHGISLKIMLSYFNHLNFDEIHSLPIVGQASLTQVNIDKGEFNVILTGDTSHYDFL